MTERLTPFDEGHVILPLTLKRGLNAGRTQVTCTCGWEHTYKSRQKAGRRISEHLTMNGVPNRAEPS